MRIYPTQRGVFTAVILANSPVSDNVRTDLDGKLTGLSETHVQQILDAQIGNTNRTLTAINKEIQTTISDRGEVFGETIRFYADTDSIISSNAIALLENENTVEADQTLLASYISGGNLSAAATKLSNMTASNDEEQSFIYLQTMLLNLAQNDLDIFQMNQDQEALVRNIAGGTESSIARSNARAILFWVFGEDYPSEFDTQTSRLSNNTTTTHSEKTSNIVYSYLGASYPNPATNSVFIPYYLPKGSKAELNIYDVNGKSVEKSILLQGENILNVNTSDLNTGVYAYSIIIDGVRAETRRMIIVKNE